MMAPNMSLAMLLMGQGSQQDVHNVIGLLNLGSALAYLAKNNAMQQLVHAAQDVCSVMMESGPRDTENQMFAVPEELKAQLIAGFMRIDRIIALTTQQRLFDAADYVRAVLEHRIQTKSATGGPCEQDLIRMGVDTQP